jgi:hypothetical protein
MCCARFLEEILENLMDVKGFNLQEVLNLQLGLKAWL